LKIAGELAAESLSDPRGRVGQHVAHQVHRAALALSLGKVGAHGFGRQVLFVGRAPAAEMPWLGRNPHILVERQNGVLVAAQPHLLADEAPGHRVQLRAELNMRVLRW